MASSGDTGGSNAGAERTVVVMQPGYIPWLGFFELMNRSDVFVVYDNVQYDKGGWRNRNRIKTQAGPLWLTVPVAAHPLGTMIRDIHVDDSRPWREKHLKTLRGSYAKAPFFDEVFSLLEQCLLASGASLLALDLEIIRAVCSYLGLKRETLMASSLDINEDDKVLRLVRICAALKGKVFYEAAGGKSYLGGRESGIFAENGIRLEFQDYRHPAYRQLHGGDFVPFLSVVDLLFNEGPESLRIIASGGGSGPGSGAMG